MRFIAFAGAAIAASIASGCGYTPRDVANPETITLQAAVMDVADSLHEVRRKYANKPKVGMYPSEATVIFNISSASTRTTGLQVGATVPAAVSPIPLTINGSDQLINNGQRGNQITIKFLNAGAKPIAARVAAAAPKKDASKTSSDPQSTPGTVLFSAPFKLELQQLPVETRK